MERIRKEELCDTGIEFVEMTHSYLGPEFDCQGITSTIIPLAYPHTYDKPENMSEEEWKETLANAAAKGTAIHEDIQRYCEKDDMTETPEGMSWVLAEKEYNIEWLANEYLVTDNRGLASKIDILAYVNGELSIIDIKRTSDIHYDTTSLQTSVYKWWFERMNESLGERAEIKHCYIFWARDKKWKFEELNVVPENKVDDLCEAYYSGAETYDFNPLPEWCSRTTMEHLAYLLDIKSKAEAEIDKIKQVIAENMPLEHYKSLSYGTVKVGYISPTKMQVFDKAGLNRIHPELIAQFTKTREKDGYITITQK